MTEPNTTAHTESVDPLLRELLHALHCADTSDLALSLCDEIVAKGNRDSLRQLIADRLHQLVPVATEPTAGLICSLLGLTLEQVSVGGRPRWRVNEAALASPSLDFASPAAAYQAAVLQRFSRLEWETNVDQGLVRARYWAWALVRSLESLGEAP